MTTSQIQNEIAQLEQDEDTLCLTDLFRLQALRSYTKPTTLAPQFLRSTGHVLQVGDYEEKGGL